MCCILRTRFDKKDKRRVKMITIMVGGEKRDITNIISIHGHPFHGRYSAIKTSIIAISLIVVLLVSSESLHVFLKQTDASPYLRYKKKESTFIVEDSKGIPYVNYGHFDKTDVGFQRSPVTVAQKAISNFYEFKRTGEEKYKDFLINNANWIIDNAVYNPAGSRCHYSSMKRSG
jgi:hypothetical protein